MHLRAVGVADLRVAGVVRHCIVPSDFTGLGPANVRSYAVGGGKTWLVQKECCGNFDYYDLFAAPVPRAPVAPEQARRGTAESDTGARSTRDRSAAAGVAVVVTSEARITDPHCDDTMQDPTDVRARLSTPASRCAAAGPSPAPARHLPTAALGGLAGRVATDGVHVVVRRPGSLALVDVYGLTGVRTTITLAPAPTGVSRVRRRPAPRARRARRVRRSLPPERRRRLARLPLRHAGTPRLATLHGATLVTATGAHLDALRFTDGHRAALLGGVQRAFMLRAIVEGVVYARRQPKLGAADGLLPGALRGRQGRARRRVSMTCAL